MQNPPRVTETTPLHDLHAQLAALRARGADRIDALRFRFLETLAARMQHCDGGLRVHLAARFDRTLQTLVERLDAASTVHADVEQPAPPLTALAELRRLLDAGTETSTAPIELKAMRYFGETWAQLSVERQIGDALQREPEHAGPLNSHLLVLRALAAMRELSPAYLKHFTIYIDALLSVEHVVVAARTPSKPANIKSRKRIASPR